MAEEFDSAVLHENYADLLNFIRQKCEEENKLILTHALDEEPPACEMLTRPAKFESWENPDLEAVKAAPPRGDVPIDIRTGERMEDANSCPHCGVFIWVARSVPVGMTLECWNCHGKFGRSI